MVFKKGDLNYSRMNKVWSKGLTKETDERIKRIAEVNTGRKRPDLLVRNKSKEHKKKVLEGRKKWIAKNAKYPGISRSREMKNKSYREYMRNNPWANFCKYARKTDLFGKLIYGNKCEICGWDKATCDTHHLLENGKYINVNAKNLVVLCPNCHRLAHCNLVDMKKINSTRVDFEYSLEWAKEIWSKKRKYIEEIMGKPKWK